MSSRGQIVLPISIRRRLNLVEGAQFLVLTDNENILLKPVREPSLDEFYSLIEQAQKTAAKLGLTEEEINAEIKAMRAQEDSQMPHIPPVCCAMFSARGSLYDL